MLFSYHFGPGQDAKSPAAADATRDTEDIKKLFPDAADERIDRLVNLHSADASAHIQIVTAPATGRGLLKTQLEEDNAEIDRCSDSALA